MKQTAVEWLVNQSQEANGQTVSDIIWLKLNLKDIQHAKEMEKEQIIEAFSYGDESGCECYSFSNPDDGEKYYNETYKSE